MNLPPCAACTVERPSGPNYVEGNLRQLGVRVLVYGHDIGGHFVLAADPDAGWVEVHVYGRDHQPVPCDAGHGRTALVPLPITVERDAHG